MEHRRYHTISKMGWGTGPWQNEPDKEQYEDPTTGLPCLVVRGPLGSLCGYVGVAEGHPWYNVSFMDLDMEGVRVHGGLSYSGFCQEGAEENGICHAPEPGEPDKVWWVGFDCGHYNDISPAMYLELKRMHAKMGEAFDGPGRSDGYIWYPTYKTSEYVKTECAELAKQAVAALA